MRKGKKMHSPWHLMNTAAKLAMVLDRDLVADNKSGENFVV